VRLELTPDELLSTTRAVRKRLDLTRPVEREVLEECFQLAQQAPTASYSQNWHFVVVQDAEKRKALAEIWREVAIPYLERGGGAAGRAHPGRLHAGHRLQAGNAQAARLDGALGPLVAQSSPPSLSGRRRACSGRISSSPTPSVSIRQRRRRSTRGAVIAPTTR